MSEPVPSTMSRKALEREIVQLRNMLAEERRLNAIRGEQLSNLTERHAALESKYDLECLSREEEVERKVQEQVEKRVAENMAEADEIYREKERMIDRRESEVRRDLETLAERMRAQMEGEYSEKMEKVLHGGMFQLADLIRISIAVKKATLEGSGAEAEAELERFREKLPEDTLTYEAMTYLLRHYDELTAYLGIAGMPIDNNDTEREIRAMVMGRKAYLYCRTEESCQRAAIMYSLLGACKVLDKDPEKWLAHTLKHIGSTRPEDLHRLLPEEWTE